MMAAHEIEAIRQIATIHQGEAQYYSQFGAYATALTALGPPASGAPGPQAADLIPRSLADGEASGYLFALTARPNGYTVSAVPKVFNSTGRRTFYSDETLVIRANNAPEPATAASPELQ